jgi:uncharacterized protein GlcG (DUF336 family)
MLTMDKARLAIEAAIDKAKKIGQPMNIAIVDAGANLVAFMRKDGAWLGSIDIAINKAFTAKAFDISTLELGRNSQPGDQFFGIHVSNHGRVMIFAGGMRSPPAHSVKSENRDGRRNPESACRPDHPAEGSEQSGNAVRSAWRFHHAFRALLHTQPFRRT